MPKINAYSRDNVFNTLGFLDLHISYLNQPVLDTSSPTFQNVNVIDDVVIGGDLFVSGNATISGNTTVIGTDIVEIKDNIILINAQETSSGVTSNLAGVEVERGTLPNFQSVFEESSDLYKIGEVGSLQAVATREDSPLDKGIIVYNELLRRLDSVTTIELPITFNSGTNSTSSTTGTVIISGGGGLGVTGDIYTDSRLYIKGTNYTSYISSNVSNELIVNPGSNFVFQQAATSQIKIPTNVLLTFTDSNKTILSNGTDLIIANTTGNISLVTQADGSVYLPTNTYLEWTPVDRMRYNGTNIVLDSSGEFLINPIINSANATVSTNSSTGSVKIAGSIAISNTTNATSATVGGTFTTAGGVAIAKDTYIGGALDVNGITTLDQTTIDTTDGPLSITGANAVSISVGSTSTFKVTSGNIDIDSDLGNVNIIGETGINLDSNAGISIDAGAASNFSTSSGTITVSGVGITLNANAGNAMLDSSLAVMIGTNVSGTPITLGTDLSTILLNGNVVIKDNTFVVNALPQVSIDSGYLVKRYQPPNNLSAGDLLSDTPLETSTFGTGSNTFSIVLNATANATDDYYNGMWITCGAGQVRRIKDYNGTTKVALLYITADNTSVFTDGLDLVTPPANGVSYNIYNKYYQAFYYNESSDEFRIVGTPLEDFNDSADYSKLHVGDLDVSGDLTVTGTISAGISTPSITLSNTVNITGSVTAIGVKLISNGNERELITTFRMTTTSVGLLSSFEFTVPGITSFANVYDAVTTVNAFSNDADPVNTENCTGFCVVTTNRAKVKFTAGSNSAATVQVIMRYNV